MVKVVRVLAAENGMGYEEVLSFVTENYVGIWSGAHNKFILVCKSDIEFDPVFIGCPGSLQELDDAVYEECEEHIIKVSDRADYKFILLGEEQ